MECCQNRLSAQFLTLMIGFTVSQFIQIVQIMKKITTIYRLNYFYIVMTFADSERPKLEASKKLVPQNIPVISGY